MYGSLIILQVTRGIFPFGSAKLTRQLGASRVVTWLLWSMHSAPDSVKEYKHVLGCQVTRKVPGALKRAIEFRRSVG